MDGWLPDPDLILGFEERLFVDYEGDVSSDTKFKE
jgi:hypothetical protein